MSLLAQEQKHWPVFSGVWKSWDRWGQSPPSSSQQVSQALVCLRGLESLRNECASSYVFTSRVELKTPQVKRNQEKEKKYTLSTKCIFKHLFPVQPDSSIEEEKVKK